MSSNRSDNGGDTAGNSNKEPRVRELGNPHIEYQAFAAVVDGYDNDAQAWLEKLSIEELRVLHFQIDRIRTLTRNVREHKMAMRDAELKIEHEANVVKPEEGEAQQPGG